jgi:1-aminocyclopropane-1-carboxylate deaminase/D-cysteine desulfhydrase-like pyridoxal-dependent ACC family enzyme
MWHRNRVRSICRPAARVRRAWCSAHGVTATDEFHVPSRTAAIANETLGVLGLDLHVTEDEIQNDAGFVDAGIPSEASIEATRLFARTEGVIPDSVYTGKAAACMVAHVQEGRYARDDTLIFVHSGGAPAVFT